ncbi:MAG: PASTA domain-containing protein [Tannerellaceae bacterium]|jgi:beta-lactam-binding protein with PASTA domain|nr:PASTA domain-containing protein [Tannerellaceae bacterium]
MKDFLIKWGKHPFVIHLLLAMFVSCLVIYGTLKWLDAYTLHNKAVIVPDMKGLRIEEASQILQKNGLRYNIVDSVFSKDVKPGAIVEIVPSVGSKVKEGRIVFITVNALSSQMGAVPDVRDLSFRQAYASLKARGFESVEIEYVYGMYKDLAVGIELRGRLLEGGEMIQLTAPLILKVSNGTMDRTEEDSLLLDSDNPLNSDAETWF